MSKGWGEEPEDDLLPGIRKEIVPGHEVRSLPERASWRRFTKGLRGLYDRFIPGYAWEQVDRLREAKLQEIESLSMVRQASAMAKRAEARKLDAEAELLYERAESARLENAERKVILAAQEQRLLEAIRRVELKGGKVSFPREKSEEEEDS